MRPLTNFTTMALALVWTASATGANAPPVESVEKVTVQRFELAPTLDDGGSAIDTLQLWYTTDGGHTWQDYDTASRAEDRIVFTAGEEGLYGFYVVATNAAGSSGPEPGPTTEPHHWALVDYSSPVVELEETEPRVRAPEPLTVVPIRWSARDTALPPRPILIEYRMIPKGAWSTIADALPNTGTYTWHVPPTLNGRIRIRLTVRDEAGHRTQVTSGPIEIVREVAPPRETTPPRRSQQRRSQSWQDRIDRGASHSVPPEIGSERAVTLYRKGVLHAMRGEYRLASSRLQDALALDSDLTEALVELGKVLYAQRRIPEAIEAYRLALRQDPNLRSAREGLALVYIGQRRFSDAVRELGHIVRSNPKDVEAWLNLGDVAIYQGDEILAREHYRKAATLDPTATEVIGKARLRLAELERLAAEFAQVDTVQ